MLISDKRMKSGMQVDKQKRRFLTTIAGASLAAAWHPSTYSAIDDGFIDQVAESAKRVASGLSANLRLLIPEGCRDNLLPIISEFNKRTGVMVTLVETPVDDINTQLFLNSMTGEGGYDLALPATFGIPDLVASEAIRSLTDLARQYEPIGYRDDMLYRTGDSFDDELYGFQTDGDVYVMFYNKERLENSDEKKRYVDTFGKQLALPETWEDLDQQMAFFHRPESNFYGGLLYRTPGYLAWEWWVRFHAKGYWPLSETLVPQISSDSGVQALEEMIRATDSLAPEVHKYGLFDNWERFSRGDIFCNIGWGGTQKYLNKSTSPIRDNLLFGPTPGGYIDGALVSTPYFNWGWNYVVTTSSQMPELAYLFALFASTSEMSTASVRRADGFFDPFKPEHYDDPEIIEIYSEEFLKVHENSMRSAIPDLYLAGQGQYLSTLSDGLQKAFDKTMTPKVALERVADQWDIISSRSNSTDQARRWKLLRQKYPEQVRSRLKDFT